MTPNEVAREFFLFAQDLRERAERSGTASGYVLEAIADAAEKRARDILSQIPETNKGGRKK